MRNSDIVNALKVLKNMCKKSINCCDCPCVLPKLSEKGRTIYCCGLTDIAPRYWDINEEKGGLNG